jgi:hypothetical protein
MRLSAVCLVLAKGHDGSKARPTQEPCDARGQAAKGLELASETWGRRFRAAGLCSRCSQAAKRKLPLCESFAQAGNRII